MSEKREGAVVRDHLRQHIGIHLKRGGGVVLLVTLQRGQQGGGTRSGTQHSHLSHSIMAVRKQKQGTGNWKL